MGRESRRHDYHTRAAMAACMALQVTGMAAAPIVGLLPDRLGRRPVLLFSLAEDLGCRIF